MRQARSQIIGLHHLAFLRSWLQGLDLRWAWHHYMAWSESIGDLRAVQSRRQELLASVLQLGHQLNLSLPPERQITAELAVLSREPVITPATVLPTLDEFIAAQGLDPDQYSEAELIELYQDHYGEHEPASGDEPGDEPANTATTSSDSEHVRALNHIAPLIALPPAATDPLSSWFDTRLATQIAATGAINLGSLVDLVNVDGHNWFKRIPYLGQTRAQRIVAWLVSVQDHLGKVVLERALLPPQRAAAARAQDTRDVIVPRQFGIVPLEQLQVPDHLSGVRGVFRTHMPNVLNASNDLAAVQGWLAGYAERRHTWRAYKKTVERFMLWCLHECGKALSSIDALDCRAYRAFLANLPPDWLADPGSRPGDTGWRPFRKQLDQSSQKHELVVVQILFAGLVDAGYLAANPMRSVMKGFALPSPTMRLDRSFTQREWDAVMRLAHDAPELDDAQRLRKQRLILLLELLVSMGLRREELAGATLADLQHAEVWGDAPAWILMVTGKRNKQREVPMPDHVVELLREHHRLCDAVGLAPCPALIRSLQSPPPKWVASAEGPSLQVQELAGHLGADGIYSSLKRFFTRAAEHARELELDPDRFSKASTHWLRHTFGRQAAADEVPVEIIQQALGHASLSTTTIYTSTERDRLIRALRLRQPRS